MTSFLSIRNWRKFQHYDPAKRQPPWIKNYTDLMANDSYLDLSSHLRGLLHGLLLEYASARCHLTFDTKRLTRRLNIRVTTADIQRLNQAGFVDIVDSAALAEGYQEARELLALARSQEAEAEKEKEKGRGSNGYLGSDVGLPFEKQLQVTRMLGAINDADDRTPIVIRSLADPLSLSSLVKVRESCERHGSVGAGYVVNALKSEQREAV